MSCDFSGSLGTPNEKDHLIVTDDPVYKLIGLDSFTFNSLREALKTRVPYWRMQFDSPANFYPFIASTWELAEEGIFTFESGWPKYEWFNTDTGQHQDYVITKKPTGGPFPSWSTIAQIMLMNRSLVRGTFDTDNWTNYIKQEAKDLIQAIKVSPEGCLKWSHKMTFNFSVGDDSGCAKQTEAVFKLYLYDKTYKKNDDRKLIARGNPNFMGVPKTSTGQKFSGLEQAESSTEPGEIIAPQGQGRDDVAGELDASYNPNTGKWESGTTNVLARLLDDLPAVTVNPFDTSAVDSMAGPEFFGKDSATNTAAFTWKWAMPLSVHQGNPHLFGPSWSDKKCKGEEKHKIKVVNRSGRNFSAGDLVMCFRIDGYWYVMDFGSDVGAAGSFKIGKWSFMNMIAERRSFFRDNRYFLAHTGEDGESKTPAKDDAGNLLYDGKVFPAAQVTPSAYEDFFRENWFFDMYTHGNDLSYYTVSKYDDYKVIALRNIGGVEGLQVYNEDVGGPLNIRTGGGPLASRNFHSCIGGYYQQSSFDLLHPSLGGVNENGNMIARTNLFRKPNGAQDAGTFGFDKAEFAPFWGATFPDGYQPTKINELKSSTYDMVRYGQQGGLLSVLNIHDDLSFYPVAGIFDPAWNKNLSGGSNPLGIWTDLADKNGLQVPADVALLASPDGENGYSMEAFYRFNSHCSFSSGKQFGFSTDTVKYMLPDINGYPSRFNWLMINDGSLDEVESPNVGTLPSLYDFKPINPHKVEFKPLWADYLGSLDITNEDSNIGPERYYDNIRANLDSLLDELDFVTSSKFVDRIGYGEQNVTQKLSFEGSALDANDYWYGVPYGYMVGGGEIPHFRNDVNAGNIVGLTLAKAKIQAKATELTFTTTQQFGITNPTIQTTSSIQSFIIGTIIQTSLTSGGSTNRIEQWGQNDDTPWRGGFGTTALHARLCDQWPDEQTLLDPRYFAVMHFNPQGGAYYDQEEVKYRPVSEKYNPASHPDGITLQKAKDEMNWEKGDPLPEFTHIVDISYTSVDFRIPTYVNEHSVTSEAPIAATINGNHYRGNQDVLLDPAHWRINPVRRGQLLPFTYPQRVIGLIFLASLDDDDYLHPALPDSDKRGLLFEPGDLITATGGHGTGVEIEVVEVTQPDAGYSGGAIKDWRITKDALGNHNAGEGYLPQDFPTTYDGDGSHEGVVKLTRKNGIGTGLDYTDGDGKVLITEGSVYDRWKKDDGPTRHPTIKKLSLSSNPPEGQGNDGGRVKGQAKNGIALDATNEGLYDLFLLFHADVQHNTVRPFLYGEAVDGGLEQYCTLEISTAS